MPFQKITPKFINKIFILGKINDHFIQIVCYIVSLYWITQVWVHFVSFGCIKRDNKTANFEFGKAGYNENCSYIINKKESIDGIRKNIRHTLCHGFMYDIYFWINLSQEKYVWYRVRLCHPWQQWLNEWSTCVFQASQNMEKIWYCIAYCKKIIFVTNEMIHQWFSLMTSSLIKYITYSTHS